MEIFTCQVNASFGELAVSTNVGINKMEGLTNLEKLSLPAIVTTILRT
jgi:hypothetical protein